MLAIDERDEAVGLAAVAVALADPGAEVDVLHVVELGAGQSFVEADATVAEAVDLVRARGLTGSGHVEATAGGVAPRLVEHARRLGPELVVMGCRGLGRVGGVVGHSVSHALLAELDVPVLVLPCDARLPLRGFRRVLASVGSEGDAAAVVAAVQLLPGVTEVLATHVPRRVALHVGRGGGQTFAEIGETSTQVLAEAVGRFEEAGIPATGQTLERAGGVAAAIADTARAWNADVIVLGARRPHEWEALVAGSTVHEVLRRSDRPVLVAGSPAAGA